MAVSSDSVSVRKLHKDNYGASRYLLRDIAPTGLEYAMFADTKDSVLTLPQIGRKVGKISKTDMRNIRK